MKAHLLRQQLRDGSLAAAYSLPDSIEGRAARDETARRRAALAHALARAKKFHAVAGPWIDDEALHASAIELFRGGVLRMPYPETYFEIDIHVGGIVETQGHIVAQAGGVTIFRSFACRPGGAWCDHGMTTRADYSATPPEGLLIAYPDAWYSHREDSIRVVSHGMVNCIDLACFISTKHAKVDVVETPDKLNKSRVAAGKPPLFGYHTVTIDPAAVRAVKDLGGTHASPRLHWRRGHLRTMDDGRRIGVRPTLVGVAERGFIDKDYAVAARAEARP